jgi:alpha-mannosidase
VMRIYESAGTSTRASVVSGLGFDGAERTNVMEEATAEVAGAGDMGVELGPYEIATLRVRARRAAPDEPRPSAGAALVVEPAQPVFADYWMHNKGAAPLGYQPVTVQIRPSLLAGRDRFVIPVSVASARTDEPVAGRVTIIVPPGWQASPSERLFRLAPGAHLAFETSVTAPTDAAAGRYFVAARIADGGQEHEDVVTIDLDTAESASPATASAAGASGRSIPLTEALERALRGGEPVEDAAWTRPSDGVDGEGEIEARLDTGSIRIAPGGQAEIVVALRNRAASEIRGEAQLISPHETWSFTRPWTVGFAVGPGEERTVRFDVAPPVGATPGAWWALVKVMYFGRLTYTESIPIVVTA